MRVLIAHTCFVGFAGTETYSLTVAEELQRMGHDVHLHAPELGAMAETMRERGLRVVDARGLPRDCDVVFAQDAATCLELSHRYAHAARIFVAHSTVALCQCPPQIAGACDAIVALNDRTLKWVSGLSQPTPVLRMRQPVDLDRFRLSQPRRDGRLRALVLSNYSFGTRATALEEACSDAGVELSWLGGVHGQSSSPELALSAADIAIGLGRSALDAMAACRATIVLGALGGDGWVTPESYSALEADGFTGRATDAILDRAALVEELARFEPELGTTSRDLVARHHDVHEHAAELVALARVLERGPAPASGAEHELARLVRLEWQRHASLVTARAENTRLTTEQAQLSEALSHVHSELAQARCEQATAGDLLRSELASAERLLLDERGRAAALARERDELIATRRWRFVASLCRPLDAARRRARRDPA
jgi:hypothetical protein